MITQPLGTYEATDADYNTAVDTAPVSLGTALKNIASQNWDYNPTSSLFRLKEKTEAYDLSDKYINKDELNAKYADMGLFFEKDTREGVVDYIVKRKKIEMERSNIISRGPKGLGAKAAYLGVGLATSFADPINVAASFVPVVGQARFAAMVAKSGKNVARLKKGFTEATIGNIAVEPIVYGVAQGEQADYDYLDSFNAIAIGSVLGAGLHVGFGKIGDQIAKLRGKPNIYQRLAAVSPENQQALLKYTIGKHLRGEKVDTGDLIVNRSRTGDKQLNELDDQIANFKKLYTDALKKGDRKSAKIYIQNIRNLQRTERQLFKAKKNANDQAVEKERATLKQRDETGAITREQLDLREKNTSQLENEAELLNQRQKLLLQLYLFYILGS